MIQNPFVIFHVGLQLSFGAVLSMQFVLPVLKSYTTRWVLLAKIPSEFLDGACMCVSIQVGTLPVLVNQFQMPTVFAVFANFVCAPLIGVIMVGGFVLIIFGVLGIFSIGKVIGAGVYFFCVLVERIALFFASFRTLACLWAGPIELRSFST